MKVLDLHCRFDHTFEGWFASEQDFVDQCARSLVQCPVCGDASITKKLSAPRLNLSASRHEPRAEPAEIAESGAIVPGNVSVLPQSGMPTPASLAKAWMAMSEKLLANTVDVGSQFAEEARKIHYGETEARAIRGQTSVDEARALIDEGIDVLPLLLPESAKTSLQ